MTRDEYRKLCVAAERGDRTAEAIVNRPYEFKTESPIEKSLVRALVRAAPYTEVPEVWEEDHRPMLVGLEPECMFEMKTQVHFGRYRADIALVRHGLTIVIECDGRAYHSTPEQAEHDAERDHYMRNRDMHVLRYTGSEIYWGAGILAEKTLRHATQLAHEEF